MHPSSSFNTTANKTESVVDNSSSIISSGGGRKAEESVNILMKTMVNVDDNGAEFVKLTKDGDDDEVEMTLVKLHNDVGEDYETEDDDSEDEEEEELDEEEEEAIRERKRILADAKKLKQMAGFFAHPERAVETDGFSCGRNVFSQPWAAETLDEDEDDERDQILADVQALKTMAGYFQHPERELEVDATASARNYFSQPWAAEQESFGDAEGRARAIAETKTLKKMATLYQHPEAPLEVDATVLGRNYFSRASAEQQTSAKDERECARVLADAVALKKSAAAFMHPEAPIQVDGVVFGRNYFSRPSAEDQEEDEMSDEREIILEEMKELKQAATDFMHPEIAIAKDATASGRNYFSRASAEDQEEVEMSDEREIILEEMKELKAAAFLHRHPEAPLDVDPTCFGRNYFSRASAEDQEEDELADERAIILEEMKELKKAAAMFLHPEKPLEVDPTCFARNYYGRASAEDQEDDELGDERAIILEEMKELKEAAVTFRHPEKPLDVDPVCFGRNYFGRESADEQEVHERTTILEEMKQLKQAAIMYRHPEAPLDVDPTCFGRNYYSRASAEEQEDDDLGDERAIILEEMKELKQAATDFLHPELPFSLGMGSRGYFGRASAPEQESFDEAEERARVLAEARSLKKLAVDFGHPELPLETDSTACARSFFSRPSAPGDSFEEAEARNQVLEDAALLKKLASDYLHPERAVDVSSTACARNYFSRASAPEQTSTELERERTAILAEATALKKLAVDFLHPEVPVKTTDPNACGRNYFTRPSSLGASEHVSSSGYANPTEHHEYAEEHSHHDDYGHFDMDEDIFADMRQKIVLPSDSHNSSAPKVQSKHISSDEEGELSRSPSSIMLFTGANLDDVDHPPLPTMG